MLYGNVYLISLFLIMFTIVAITVIVRRACRNPHIFKFASSEPGKTIVLIGGTHGNEPSGAVYLRDLITSLGKRKAKLIKGTVIIIPELNKCGLQLKQRLLPDLPWAWDINRNYSKNKSFYNKYLKFIDQADLIIDCHEGWGFAKINPGSLGSGIYYNGLGDTQELAKKMVAQINQTITEEKHKFIYGKNKTIPGSLGTYSVNNNIPYILIETSGQNNIQPLPIRIKQVEHAIKTLAIFIKN